MVWVVANVKVADLEKRIQGIPSLCEQGVSVCIPIEQACVTHLEDRLTANIDPATQVR